MKYDKLFNQITITECTPTMVKMLGSIHLKLEYAGESLATTCYGKCDYNENTYSMHIEVREYINDNSKDFTTYNVYFKDQQIACIQVWIHSGSSGAFIYLSTYDKLRYAHLTFQELNDIIHGYFKTQGLNITHLKKSEHLTQLILNDFAD